MGFFAIQTDRKKNCLRRWYIYISTDKTCFLEIKVGP